ncbi:uncharacterized protein LOC131687473 [Topomyia yanbarensis]|uniref:uncharacterized protein LOC131687473 n=1 Tax=Topomyia yanbarensis TaxID=2498891 RepID=UPI00273A9356|nr:uncharacterized protein LOC131687473 [Topomyia yanbarensis]
MRSWYNKLKSGVQALSGKLQRAKLLSTKSLPASERLLESSFDAPDIIQLRVVSVSKKRPASIIDGISFESAVDIVNKNQALLSDNSLSSADFIDDGDNDDCYDSGLVDEPSYGASSVLRRKFFLGKNISACSGDSGLPDGYGSSQQHVKCYSIGRMMCWTDQYSSRRSNVRATAI